MSEQTMSKEQIDEMETVLNNYFDNTPMELSFKHENGDTDIITDEKALAVIDAITRQALIPLFCEVLYGAVYRKQVEGEWIRKDGFLVCSNCDGTKPFAVINDNIHYFGCPYCNKCGAKMKGEGK